MTKVLLDKYPLGSLPNQKTPGRYMDDYLKANIDILAEKITSDLQFLGLCSSSTFEVRTGKSTFLQQIGEYYTDVVNRKHNLNLTFNMNNIVFSAKELMNRAFQLPKYSVLILDENDELDEHYFSELSRQLRLFFRKSGQLNLFILLICPNFFQLKPNYAISRSNFLIDVKFGDGFERGYFDFYSFKKKKKLYLLGKKTQDYDVVRPDFNGRFVGGYAVDEKEYRKAKEQDLKDSEKPKEDNKLSEKEIVKRLFVQVRDRLKGKLSQKEICFAFGISERTGVNYSTDYNTKLQGVSALTQGKGATYNYITYSDQDKNNLEGSDG